LSATSVSIWAYAKRPVVYSVILGPNRPVFHCVCTSITDYLDELKSKLKTAQHYASTHLERHIRHYNLQARRKSFQAGNKCLILQPESTALHALRRWKGPAEVIEAVSPHSYIVDYNGTRYKLHANLLRKFNVRVDEVIVECINILDLSPLQGACTERCTNCV